MLLIEYPKCTTCQRAKKWLEGQNVCFAARDIKAEHPTYEELCAWLAVSGLPLKKWFNTSGLLYRSLRLKDRLTEMKEEEQLRLLASDGMLIKRPLLITEERVLVGFREKEWAEALSAASRV